MIRPPGFAGVVFGTAREGDARTDPGARVAFDAVGVPSLWAYVSQVHGATVKEAIDDGSLGEADAIFTVEPGLAITVATADCVPIGLEGPGFVAVAHAGWRGMSAGVIEETLAALHKRQLIPKRAAIGPAIGPCCYEVGEEVVDQFPERTGTTTWGTPSVDLVGAVVDRLGGLEVWQSGRCTMTDTDLFSYRETRTPARQVAVAWLPNS